MRRGKVLLQLGQFSRAEEQLEEILKEKPDTEAAATQVLNSTRRMEVKLLY